MPQWHGVYGIQWAFPDEVIRNLILIFKINFHEMEIVFYVERINTHLNLCICGWSKLGQRLKIRLFDCKLKIPSLFWDFLISLLSLKILGDAYTFKKKYRTIIPAFSYKNICASNSSCGDIFWEEGVFIYFPYNCWLCWQISVQGKLSQQ